DPRLLFALASAVGAFDAFGNRYIVRTAGRAAVGSLTGCAEQLFAREQCLAVEANPLRHAGDFIADWWLAGKRLVGSIITLFGLHQAVNDSRKVLHDSGYLLHCRDGSFLLLDDFSLLVDDCFLVSDDGAQHLGERVPLCDFAFRFRWRFLRCWLFCGRLL